MIGMGRGWRRRRCAGRSGAVAAALFAAALLAASITALAPAAAFAGNAGGEAGTAAAASVVPEPDGYRMGDYKGATPATLKGGTVIDTATAHALQEAGVPFVDVLPRAPRPKDLPRGTLWHPKPRRDIPGSTWLVDTGYGELAPVMERYFLDGLAAVTHGDRRAPFVVYCKRDCWMSYNAARRAVAAGYTSVRWYPDGTDGWAEAGYPLAKTEPRKRPDE